MDKALERGYAVVAVSSVGRCWSVEDDGPRVRDAIFAVLGKPVNAQLARKPVFAFGASSGGAFVGTLPFITSVDGIIAQISGVRLPKLTEKASLSQELRAMGGGGQFPPTVFSHMPRDEVTSKMVDSAKTYLESMDVPVRVTELKPLAVHDEFFSERVRGVGGSGGRGGGEGRGQVGASDGSEEGVYAKTSAKMVAALRGAGFLDSNGYLKEDPRASDWRQALAPMANADSLQPDKSPLSEVLNVAYALHELSADGFEQDVEWLEKMHANANAVVGPGAGGDGETESDAGGVIAASPRRAAPNAGVGAGT